MPGRLIMITSMVFLLVLPVSWDLSASELPLEPGFTKKDEIHPLQAQLLKEFHRLKQDKILVTKQTYRQAFEPYLHSKSTIFITSDAVLNAFHILFKESVFHLEQRNADTFPDILRLIYERILLEEKKTAQKFRNNNDLLKQNFTNKKSPLDFPELKRAAILRIKIIIAIALKLSGDSDFKINKKLKWIVNKEVNRIINADGFKMPTWIGNSTDVSDRIDYSIFKPRGFYTQSGPLRRYYRAFKWCQSVPFRIDRDEELLGIFILGKIIGNPIHNNFQGRLEIENFFKCHKELLGRKEERDILLAAQIFRERPKNLVQVRQYVIRRSLDIKKNNSLPDHKNTQKNDLLYGKDQHFYIISPFHLPDSFLFQDSRLNIGSQVTRDKGLKICAVLGSEYAREQLMKEFTGEDSTLFMKSLNKMQPFFKTENIYHQYLNCLEALLDRPEPDAPDFMKKDFWQIKSCNTVLSGWAMFRHSWELHHSQVSTGDDTVEMENPPPGFVEPEPEFFARLGEYVEETRQFLDRYHGFQKPKNIISKKLRVFSDLIARKKYPRVNKAHGLKTKDLDAIKKSISCLAAVGNIRYHDEGITSRRKEIISKINAFAKDIENGKYDDEPNFEAFVLQTNLDIKYLWHLLSNICRRLEVIAHKQLRDVSLNEKDNYFFTVFGEKLATVMLYSEDTYKNPGDNAPGITDVYYQHDPKHILHAATGRPRELLILYPYKGREVIGRGVIIPYYEFVLPGKIIDEQWKELLGSDEQPNSPGWFAPILYSGKIMEGHSK